MRKCADRLEHVGLRQIAEFRRAELRERAEPEVRLFVAWLCPVLTGPQPWLRGCRAAGLTLSHGLTLIGIQRVR